MSAQNNQKHQEHTIDVPGARLHYEVRGSGPVVALIGHPMDTTGFVPLAEQLADDYTVVTYDPRGISRSTIDDPEQDAEPDLIGDELHRLLAAVTDEPAYVFGSSGGAVTTLALTAAHPEQVRVLVAHEPPLTAFLPDAEAARAAVRDIYETYQTDPGAAWSKFFALTALAPDAGDQLETSVPEADGQPEAEHAGPPSEPSEQDMANAHRMMAHSLLPITGYRPDIDALRSSSTRVVIGVGATSAGQFANRTGVALAERLGSAPVAFPSDHAGFLTEPKVFADQLRELFRAR